LWKKKNNQKEPIDNFLVKNKKKGVHFFGKFVQSFFQTTKKKKKRQPVCYKKVLYFLFTAFAKKHMAKKKKKKKKIFCTEGSRSPKS